MPCTSLKLECQNPKLTANFYRDAIQEFTDTLDIPRVKSFIVSGASKRGWTTWLAAGVDKRVEAFAPIVMPILNMQPNLNNMYRSLGGWTWAFRDYVSLTFF